MASTPREVQSPREYEEILPVRDPISDLNSHTNPQTIGEYQTKLQDLHRENFNLKLRIFFLEQNESGGKKTLPSSSVQRSRHASQYEYYDPQDPSNIQQTGYENDQHRQPLSPHRHRGDIQTNSETDELRPIRNRHERDRQDNEKSRRLARNSDEFEENTTTLNIDPTSQRIITTPPVDSDLVTTMPVSTYNLQLEERERHIRDENNALKKENAALTSRLKETSNRLNHINDQHQVENRKHEEQLAKAERVIKRITAEYDDRIANMQEEQRQKLADYESYRHEQEQTNSNVNNKEYLREIEHRDRIIKELTEKLKGTNAYQQKPYTVLLPSAINPQAADEDTRRFNEYVESIEQLRAECDELRRSEKYLRRQVDDLNRLFEPSTGRLPPIPRASIVDDIQQVDDPQSAIVQTSLQLRNDAENVSGLTNRIAQMIRERDDNQNRLKEKDAQIRQYETREAEFENRIIQKSDLQIDELQQDIKHLKKQIENRDRHLKELADENAQLRLHPRRDDKEIENHYSRDKRNLQEKLHNADEQINDLRQELDKEQQQHGILRRDYEKVRTNLNSQSVEELESTIKQQEKQIENNQTQLQELENNFQQQRIYLERERDFEKGKVDQVQNELNVYKRRYHDLESQYEQLRPLMDEQQIKYEKQIRNYQNELSQIEQVKTTSINISNLIFLPIGRDDLNEELQLLRDGKQTSPNEIRDNDPKLIELKEQIARYERRFHDSEDENKRYRNEFNTLQDDYQTTSQQYDDLKLNYAKTQNNLSTVEIEKNQIQMDNQTLNEENTKLQHELDELEVKIRIQINEEYENEYRNRYNDLNQQKDAEIQNVQRDKETVEFELERVNNERSRFDNQLHQIQDELQIANETIENYERDIDRLREDLNRSKEKNDQIERDISRTYTEQLKDQNDRIEELENQLKTNEEQINQYERRLPNLSQVHPSERASNYYEQSQFDDNNEPYERRQRAPNNQELIYQLENKLREQDDVIQSLRNSRAIIEGEPTDIELELQIRIQRLEQDLETKERFIQKYSETVEAQEQQIEKLLENLKQGDNSQLATIETLQEELENRKRRIDEILNDKNSALNHCERQIGELQLNIQDCEHKIADANEKLEQAEQKIDTQQLEIEDLTRQNHHLTIVPEDKETYLKQIRELEKELEMEQKINDATPSEQRDHYQSVIEDLKARLRSRDDSIQRQKQYINFDEHLQRSLRTSDEELKDTRQAQSKMAGDYNRTNLHTDQLTSDVENRDHMITSLREKLSEKDQEINKLHENNLAKDQKLNELYSKMIQLDPDFTRSQSISERAPTNVSLKVELQRKDREINDLKQKLDEARRDKPDQSDLSTASTVPRESRTRPRSNYEHLNREELLFELDMTLQHNQDLNDQLRKKFPNITELHNQSVEVRNELSRQKYVNQVLWRKLNALIDIHGSNTRNELAIELANYQDELAKLKLQQTRTNDTRSAVLNANSRSSSEQNVRTLSSMGNDLPSKNIKSTIALLERSNIEWQTKLARLTGQLGRSESQSRNYHRELIKYQKLLHDAGLTESSVRQRRRSADDSVMIGLTGPNKINDDLTNIDNLDELKEIIRHQRKFNQQLQMRLRLNTPDIIQSPVIEKLQEQIQNLNLVIDTYKNESNLLKTELKKLYKTIEHNRKTSQQSEQLLQDQQLSFEQLKKKLIKYDQLLKKYDLHSPIFDDNREHLIDPIDEYIIDLDIDIIQGNEKKTKASLGKKDSALSSATDTQEYQRQIREKDQQIRNLNNQLNDKDEQIQQMINELNNSKKPYEDVEHPNHNDHDRSRRDLTDELHATQNELQEARLQLDALKSSKPQYDQADEQNQRLRGEIKHLQNEIERIKPLMEHYKTQIDILEEKSPSLRDNDTSEMVIRKSELSQLLEEMRLLRRDLERSLQKQNELQAKLDENIRQSLSPREFTFSGRGVSYPDLRLIDGSSLIGAENLSLPSQFDNRRSRPVGSLVTDLDQIEYPPLSTRETERTIPMKSYVIGETRTHNELRQLIEDIKFNLKALGPELKDKSRSRISSSITDASTRSLEERLISLDEHLTHALDLMETYWKADLPEKNSNDEHLFNDHRLMEENKHLLLAQRKYAQDVQFLRQKYKEQSTYLDQLLAQLTKANRKKADTGEYLALLLRPTLDVLQKARSNIENHLKETNINNTPPGSAQSYHHHHRRHRPNHQD